MRALREGELLDRAFASAADLVPARDRNWMQELVYGTVRLRGRMDQVLSQFVKRRLDSLDADVLDIMRLAVYQLIEMDSVPAYAAVSQAVELTKTSEAKHAAGFVNGVLQSVRRSDSAFGPAPELPLGERLATWGSHPAWLVERWLQQFGAAGTEQLIRANNSRPQLFLRAVDHTREAALQQLQESDIPAEPVADLAQAIRIEPAQVLRALAALPVVVQDPAAMLVVSYAAFGPGTIADLCAAPGGKALTLWAPDGRVLAGDNSFARLDRLRENAARVGRTPAFFVGDARRPPFRTLPQVLIDAPCTGTGTLRRHPDGKWRLSLQDVTALARLQSAILEAVAPLIEPGGLLVYATCSLEPEENELQVARFLAAHDEFTLEPPPDIDARFVREGMLRVLPQEHGWDGAFAARMRRAA